MLTTTISYTYFCTDAFLQNAEQEAESIGTEVRVAYGDQRLLFLDIPWPGVKVCLRWRSVGHDICPRKQQRFNAPPSPYASSDVDHLGQYIGLKGIGG
jgi:hypothetical protein